jgi:PBP1b-binding outer membrane lipoprotein LpoB
MVTWIRIVMVLLLCLPFLSGCSDNKEKKEKSAIEQTTDKAAKEAVEMIKVPLDKAKTAAEQENNRSRRIEEEGNKR